MRGRFTLCQKLMFAIGIILIPIYLLGQLLLNSSMVDIEFAKKEIRGLNYIRDVWQVLSVALDGRDALRAQSGPLIARLRDDNATYGQDLGTMDAAKALADEIAKASSDTEVYGVPAVTIALIQKAADGSNLTLDPDIDTFYLQDAVTVKLPATVASPGNIIAALDVLKGKANASFDDRGQVLVTAKEFVDNQTALKGDYDTAAGGNADATLAKNTGTFLDTLGSDYQAIANTIKAYHDKLSAGQTIETGADIRSAEKGFRVAADKLWVASANELEHLLKNRIDRFYSKLVFNLSIAIGLSVMAIGIVVAVCFNISGGIATITSVMTRIAEGELTAEVPFERHRNELGTIARAAIVFRSALARIERMAAERMEMERQTAAERRQMLNETASDLDRSVGAIVLSVSRAATELERSSKSLSDVAEDVAVETNKVSDASASASNNVSTVAAATEQLSSSIAEIQRQIMKSGTISDKALRDARQTNDAVVKLAETAETIGGIVDLINEIAGRTNLLALNATIEAARAGTAGRGFAVVASEVKQLADQTAKATAQISAQIGSIQSQTHDAAMAIGNIGSVIETMSEISGAISLSITEQSKATEEIARNVALACKGTADVASGIRSVTDAARHSSDASSDVNAAAAELSVQSERLQAVVSQFVASVQAA